MAEVKLDKSSVSLQNLSAWEQWLVTKAKEERLKVEQKALEVQLQISFISVVCKWEVDYWHFCK